MVTDYMAACLSKKQTELKERLYGILNDRDFVLGVGCTLKGDDEVQEMLDFIDSDGWDIPSDLTAKALFIERDRAMATAYPSSTWGDSGGEA